MTKQWLTAVSLAPLLGATQTLVNASAIAALSVLIIALHQLLMRPLQHWFTARHRMFASVLLAAALVTCLELSLRAWALPLYQALSPYPALIAVQCLVFEYAQGENRSWRNTTRLLVGFAVLCLTLGMCRELLAGWTGLRLAALLPGAFFLMGLLLALYNWACLRRAPPRRQGKR